MLNHVIFPPALVVFYRQVLSWRTLWRQFLILRLIEPTIFFYGVSLGFSQLIPQLAGHDYKSFLLPGSMAMGIMFGSLIDGSYGAYTRIFMQKTWPSFLATPTPVSHIMAGELAWTSLRNTMAAVLIFITGSLLGAHVSFIGLLLALPIVMLLAGTLMSIGYIATSFARNMDDFDCIWAFILTPMMVFSGVMVDIHIFPAWLQTVAQFMPLTHGIAALRGLLLGGMPLLTVLGHAAVIAAMGTLAVLVAHHRLKKRLVENG